MRSEEFIATISQMAEDTEKFEEVRKGIPLGMDVVGNVMLAQKRATPLTTRHTCVTGIKRVSFIRRLVITLSCLFEKDEAAFFIISPKTEYGELLRLQNIDATVPYVRSKEDLEAAKTTLKELIQMRMHGRDILVCLWCWTAWKSWKAVIQTKILRNIGNFLIS